MKTITEVRNSFWSMKNTIISLALLVAIIGCKTGPETFVPVQVNYFNELDTLLPDYAVSDTLIVVEWYELNNAIAYTEQQKDFGSDQDTDSLFHSHCVTMPKYRKALKYATLDSVTIDAAILYDELKEALCNNNY